MATLKKLRGMHKPSMRHPPEVREPVVTSMAGMERHVGPQPVPPRSCFLPAHRSILWCFSTVIPQRLCNAILLGTSDIEGESHVNVMSKSATSEEMHGIIEHNGLYFDSRALAASCGSQ